MARLGRAEKDGYAHGMNVSLLVEKVADSLAAEMRRVNDHTVECNEVPSRVQELPLLLREVANFFRNNNEDANVVPANDFPIVSKIINRFYPKMKFGSILASVKVKPGYRSVVADFNISNKTAAPVQEEIGLFVAKIDDINTSSCIVTPPQANFLLNGKGVQGRINVSMDTGPQLPTNITAMLNHGMNVLQAVGQFDGDCIIIIAYMHEMSSSDTPLLQDYVRPVTPSESCSDTIHEPSQVSLNCPISTRRIKTPVKGHCCKHYQCFDYESFVMLNSKRPLWSCPICSQTVCYTDIRIDQNIAEILKEVGENAVDVIVSADGSWKVVFESDDSREGAYERMQGCQREMPELHDSVRFSSVPSNVIDLTMEEADTGQGKGILESEGWKYQDDLPHFSVAENLAASDANNVIQGITVQTRNNMLSSPLGSTSATPATNMVDCSTAGIPNFPHSSFTLPSAQSNVILNEESVNINGANQVPLTPSPDIGCGINTGASQATQVFPAHYPTVSEVMRNLNSRVPNGASSQSMTFVSPDVGSTSNVSTERGQQFGRVSMDSLLVSDTATHSTQNHLLAQNLDGKRSRCFSDQVVEEVLNRSPYASSSSFYRPPSWCPSPHYLNSPTMQTTQATIPSQNMLQSPQNINLSGMRTNQAAIPSQNMFGAPLNFNLSGVRTTQATIPSQNMFHAPLNTQNSFQARQYSNLFGMRTTQAATPSQTPVQAQNMVQPSLNSNYTSRGAILTPSMVHPSTDAQAVQFQRRGSVNQGVGINNQPPQRTASQTVSHMLRTASFVPVQLEPSGRRSSVNRASDNKRSAVGSAQPVSMAETCSTLASNENWRPSGRMRGSLTGQAYNAALKQFLTQPIQPPQSSTTSSAK